MKWIEMLVELVGPTVAVVKALAGDQWDPDKAEAVLKGIVRNPPRQAVDDDGRDRLRDLAGSD